MDRTARFWDWIAARYARGPVADEAAYRRKLALTQAAFPPNSDVLEIGCGTGTTAVHHAPHVRHIHAVDVSDKMLSIARDRAQAAGATNITFERADIEDLEFAPESTDAVLALSILHLLLDWAKVVGLIHDAIRPGGIFVSSTACLGGTGMAWIRIISPVGRATGLLPQVQSISPQELRDTVQRAGFVIEEDWRPAPKAALFLIARKPL